MKIKNANLFPDVFIDVLSHMNETKENRDSMNYSATQIIRTPREVHLVKRYRNEIVPDAVREWYSFMGEAVHNLMEKNLEKDKRYLLENRFIRTEEVDYKGKKQTLTIGFKPDNYRYVDSTLFDYKVTTSYIHGMEAKIEWEQQLNLYARELELQGLPVKKIQVLVFYRDWREASGKYKSVEDYPQSPVASFDVPLWPKCKVDAFYYERLSIMLDHEDTPDDDLPLCSTEDMWEKPSTFAIYRPGSPKAMRLLPTMSEVKEYIALKKLTDVQVEHRQGRRTKCELYCDAAPFCNQYKDWVKAQEQNDVNAIGV